MKTLNIFLAGTALAVISLSCSSHATDKGDEKKAVCISDSMMKMITLDTVRSRSIDDELKLSGEVSFDENKVVKVFPFSSGQVVSVNTSLGDHVRAGQVLAVIKSADIAGNYADLSSAGSDVSIAKRQMENAEHLYQNGIGSEKEYLEARENYQKAVTGQVKIQKQISINGGGKTASNGLYTVVAPKSGYVVEKTINPGQFIRNDNGQNLFTIGDISDVWIWANVYESDISKVREGYTARVSTLAYPDSVFTGKVDKVSQILDPQTKVMKIRVRLPNPKGYLKPEMFANISIENTEGRTALAVPSSSIVSEDGKNFVVIYKDKCSLESREVQILKSAGNYSFIKSGLTQGEKLIADNQLLFFRQLQELK
ncbi:MAG: efflux RND transporter periplasmic adaptor subunit [Flavisolibacter sp.]